MARLHKEWMYIADHNNLPAYGRIPPPKPQREEIVKAFRGVRNDAFWPGPASYNDTRRKSAAASNCEIVLRVLRLFSLMYIEDVARKRARFI